eukprot:768314-Hanusia_phi.AAC.2
MGCNDQAKASLVAQPDGSFPQGDHEDAKFTRKSGMRFRDLSPASRRKMNRVEERRRKRAASLPAPRGQTGGDVLQPSVQTSTEDKKDLDKTTSHVEVGREDSRTRRASPRQGERRRQRGPAKENEMKLASDRTGNAEGKDQVVRQRNIVKRDMRGDRQERGVSSAGHPSASANARTPCENASGSVDVTRAQRWYDVKSVKVWKLQRESQRKKREKQARQKEMAERKAVQAAVDRYRKLTRETAKRFLEQQEEKQKQTREKESKETTEEEEETKGGDDLLAACLRRVKRRVGGDIRDSRKRRMLYDKEVRRREQEARREQAEEQEAGRREGGEEHAVSTTLIDPPPSNCRTSRSVATSPRAAYEKDEEEAKENRKDKESASSHPPPVALPPAPRPRVRRAWVAPEDVEHEVLTLLCSKRPGRKRREDRATASSREKMMALTRMAQGLALRVEKLFVEEQEQEEEEEEAGMVGENQAFAAEESWVRTREDVRETCVSAVEDEEDVEVGVLRLRSSRVGKLDNSWGDELPEIEEEVRWGEGETEEEEEKRSDELKEVNKTPATRTVEQAIQTSLEEVQDQGMAAYKSHTTPLGLTLDEPISSSPASSSRVFSVLPQQEQGAVDEFDDPLSLAKVLNSRVSSERSADVQLGYASEGQLGYASEGQLGYASEGQLGYASEGQLGYASEGQLGYASEGQL